MSDQEHQRIITTTVTENSIRWRRLRYFSTGIFQLIFGGFALLPVLLLGPHPLTITLCVWLAFTGMIGILAACFASNTSSTHVYYDAALGTQRVETIPPAIPRIYTTMIIVGFILGAAGTVYGIVRITEYAKWDYAVGAVAVGVSLFLALNQMLMICCVAPMMRSRTDTAEHVNVIRNTPAQISSGATAPPLHDQRAYPYIDEGSQPVKEPPPTYHEATQFDHPQKMPTAPAP